MGFAAEWKAVNTGLTNLEVRSLAVDPTRSTTLYAGTHSGLFKSLDGGATWRQSGLPDRATIHLVIDVFNPRILYAATACTSGGCICSERLLFKSTDGGASWSDSVSPPNQACDDIRALLLNPTDANTLYYAALNLSGFPPLSKSTDGGVTWRYLFAPGFEDVLAMAINPLAPNNLYAGGYAFPDPNGVLKSTDGGMTWSKAGLAETTVTALAIDPLNPNTLYAGTGGFLDEGFHGLFKSTDSGASWSGINHGLSDLIDTESSIAALVIDPRSPNTLYAGTTGNGVFKTSDGGASWIRFNDGLSNRNVRALVLAPGASGLNILYAGTAGGGIFKVLDDGVVTDPVPVSRTFFVPIILSSPGIGGAFYESELTLANRSTREAAVEFTYTAGSGGGSGQARANLEPGRQLTVPSAIAYLRQLGIPIPESGNHYGTLRVRFFGLPTSDEAAVFVRTTTAVAQGRAGVAYSGVPMASLSGYQALYGLRQDDSYRTNLALQNAGQAQDGDITLRVRVLSNKIPEPDEHLLHVVIPPGGFYQINEILHYDGLDLSSGYLEVYQIGGYAPFHTYAVMHNRASPDSVYIPPFSRSSSRLTIPTIPRREAGFRCELVLNNSPIPFFGDKKVSLSFQAVEQEVFAVKAEIALKQNEEKIISDVDTWLRELGSSIRGRPFQAVKGPLVVTVEDRIGGDLATLSLGMRVWASNKGGQYGFSFPAIPADKESRAATWLFGLQQNSETRSNLAIVNLGLGANRFVIEVFDGNTGKQVGRVDDVAVDPQGSFQLNSLLADYAPGVTQGYARVVPSSAEPFVTYAVIIDGARPGERTGDGSVVNSLP
jgi:photosystem II stability/assembly factor-like uncharacterized protein